MKALLLALALLAGHTHADRKPDAPPKLDWSTLFSRVGVEGAEFSETARSLDGKRVRFRGYALASPIPDGGLFLTRAPEGRLHPDDEDTLPWDAVAVLWKP